MKWLDQLKEKIQGGTNIVLARLRRKVVPGNFERLEAELPTIKKFSQSGGASGFFAQEVLRFCSIAGTLLAIEGFSLDETSSVEERYITHTLSRSLLENYFWIIYLFDDSAKTSTRFEELKNSFKKDYVKLLNEEKLPGKAELEPADPLWASLQSGLDVNSMLGQVEMFMATGLVISISCIASQASIPTAKTSEPSLRQSLERNATFPYSRLGSSLISLLINTW